MSEKLFSSPQIQRLLAQAASKLESLKAEGQEEKLRLLRGTIEIIKRNAEAFDESCQVNISWIGSHLQSALEILTSKSEITMTEVDDLYGTLYRFVVEFDLSIKSDLSLELRRFQNYIVENENNFSEATKRQALYARQEMPISVMKHLISSDVIQNLQSLEKVSQGIKDRIDQWEGRVALQEAGAAKLENSLKEYKTAFNFVGLHQGFDELSNTKKMELSSSKKWLLVFGLLSVLPLSIELILLFWNRDVLDELIWVFVATAVPAVSLTLLMIYFFRIALRNTEAAKAQLLQIEFRKTLCRFIQSYAEYSQQLKENNVDALAKFENVIFAGIVSNEEKLPSTFDGMEQIANIVRAIKGAP